MTIPTGLGSIIALIVLVVCVVLFVVNMGTGGGLVPDIVLALIAALALSRLT